MLSTEWSYNTLLLCVFMAPSAFILLTEKTNLKTYFKTGQLSNMKIYIMYYSHSDIQYFMHLNRDTLPHIYLILEISHHVC